ncbi:EpsG family protein [Ralstonia flatus]|nr:EpsG family protein [Ralstonia sp. LMG 32965]MBN6211866.1 EpsG family protein [Ralstonia pickettii]
MEMKAAYKAKSAAGTILRAAPLLALILISALVAHRPPSLDKDYYGYLDYYGRVLAGETGFVEPGFIVVTWLLDRLGGEYIHLLGMFCFFGLWAKHVAIRRLTASSPGRMVAFWAVYTCVFFPLWELTQIRAGLAMGIVALALTSKSKLSSCILFLIAGMFHYSALVVFVFWGMATLFGSTALIWSALTCMVVYLFQSKMPYFDVYSAKDYAESFNPFSFKSAFIFIVSACIGLFSWPRFARMIAFISISMLLLYWSMPGMPSAAIRIADIALYLVILALVASRNRTVDRPVWRFAMPLICAYFVYLNFFAPDAIIAVGAYQ